MGILQHMDGTKAVHRRQPVAGSSRGSIMNHTKINELKQAAEAAHAAYTTEQARLVEAGFKSAERYAMLKDLKAASDAAHAAYAKYAKGQINRELVRIIEADRPAREAGARARSAWKQAKFDAANK